MGDGGGMAGMTPTRRSSARKLAFVTGDGERGVGEDGWGGMSVKRKRNMRVAADHECSVNKIL